MVVESFPRFIEWLIFGSEQSQPALVILVGIAIAAVLAGIFMGYVIASFRHGPFEAFYVVAQVIGESLPDFLGISFRRIAAIARLAIKEALRRKVILVTFGIFALALLFGGWFMNTSTTHPDRIYVNFVLWGTQLLVLLMGMLISAFSLPEDIRNRTIYTVVTKPVRSTEVVFGRILGFGLLGTALLAGMALISFLFVWRGLSHTHRIGDATTQTMAEFYEVDQETMLDKRGKRVSPGTIMAAETESASGHRHRLEVIKDVRDPRESQPADRDNIWKEETREDERIVYYRVLTEPVSSHIHRARIDGDGENAGLTLGNATGYFRARVPIYASRLSFTDRKGEPKASGISVGLEWEYRGFIDGGSPRGPTSLSSAIFEFEDFSEDRFGDDEILPLEMTLGVFRTTKGQIERRVLGSIRFESVGDDKVDNRCISEPIIFETDEFNIQTLPISRKQPGRIVAADGTVLDEGLYDLFEEFAPNGKLKLILRCEDRNQYIGCARADVYFRAQDDVYFWNFLKGYLGIWCQMIVIISLGVALSTFLSAPVTMLASLVAIIVGFFGEFIRKLAEPDVSGGGPVESFYRLVTQNNMETPLETGFATTMIEQVDKLLVYLLDKLTYLAPDFAKLNFSDFLTYGYSIDTDRILVAITISLGFCLGLTILGYFCLKTREIAK